MSFFISEIGFKTSSNSHVDIKSYGKKALASSTATQQYSCTDFEHGQRILNQSDVSNRKNEKTTINYLKREGSKFPIISGNE